MTAGLIKSYKKLSPLIWHDLKMGIMNNLLPKDLLPQIRAAHTYRKEYFVILMKRLRISFLRMQYKRSNESLDLLLKVCLIKTI